jgi:hypothetical protein
MAEILKVAFYEKNGLDFYNLLQGFNQAKRVRLYGRGNIR